MRYSSFNGTMRAVRYQVVRETEVSLSAEENEERLEAKVCSLFIIRKCQEVTWAPASSGLPHSQHATL